MKRGTRFIVVLTTSILTFGTLMATVGPKEFNKHFQHYSHKHGCMHQCDEYRDNGAPQQMIPSTTKKTDTM